MAGIEGEAAVSHEGYVRTLTPTVERPAVTSPERPMAALDVLRFLAAVMVMAFHFGYWFSFGGDVVDAGSHALANATWWGWVGVQIFFVISGFVIALSAEHRTVRPFVRSRVLRLLPGLLVFAVLSFTVLVTYQGVPLSDGLILLAKSLVLFPKGPWVDGVYWSLTVEVLFYSGIALLLALNAFDRLEAVVKLGAAFSLLLAILILAVDAGFFSQTVQHVVVSVRDAYWSRFALISTGPYFIAGLALFYVRRDGMRGDWLAVLASAMAASEVHICHWAVREMPVIASGWQALTPGIIFAVAVLFLLAIARGQETASKWSLRMRRLSRTLGLASYPLYLVHFVTGRMIYSALLGHGVSQSAAMALAMGVCVAASVAFAIYAEPLVRQRLAMIYDKVVAVIDGFTTPRGSRPGIAAAE